MTDRSTDPASQRLADLVDRSPGAARVLEGFSLDYCCGGDRTLEEACSTAGIDPSTVVAALSSLAPGDAPEWRSMGPTDLVDHLEATHHAYLHMELPRLVQLAEKVAGVHGDRHPELDDVQHLVAALRADLEPHLMKEERVLFPMIRELEAATAAPSFHCGTLQNPIRMMMLEHDRAGDLLAALRRTTGGYEAPADGCASYRSLYEGLAALETDTHQHVHKENNVLFPAVVSLEAQLAAPVQIGTFGPVSAADQQGG